MTRDESTTWTADDEERLAWVRKRVGEVEDVDKRDGLQVEARVMEMRREAAAERKLKEAFDELD